MVKRTHIDNDYRQNNTRDPNWVKREYLSDQPSKGFVGDVGARGGIVGMFCSFIFGNKDA